MAFPDVVIRSNVDQVKRWLIGVSRDDLKFVQSYALNMTARDIRDAEQAEMRRVFDRPVRYTTNSMWIKRATKDDLTAQVFFRPGGGGKMRPAWKYLYYQAYGGQRANKAFETMLISAGVMKRGEYAVPGSAAKLNAYGNIEGGHIVRVLSQLKALERVAGFKGNATERTTARRKRGNKPVYFVLRNSKSAPDGIYERRPADGSKIEPYLVFVRRASYRPVFQWQAVATRTAAAELQGHFRTAIVRYVRPERPVLKAA